MRSVELIMLTQKDYDEIEVLVREIVREEIKLLPTKEEFFFKMDELMKEVKDSREEQTVLSGQVSDTIDRIEKLENPRSQIA